MLRPLHSFLGLAAALLLVALATSGALLAIDPVRERLTAAAPPAATVSVADVAELATRAAPGVDRIERKPSGAIVVTYFEGDSPAIAVIDPATGALSPAPEPSPFMLVVKNLHRKLLLDDPGRVTAGLGAFAMLVLAVSGLAMLARGLGGWRKLAGPVRGTAMQRLHGQASRAAVAGLLISALTGVAMSLTTFEVLPDGAPASAEAARSAEGPTLSPAQIPLLRDTPLASLRTLSFPYADDPTDVFRLATADGESNIDRATGAVLSTAANTPYQSAYQVIYALHTGELAWPLTVLLGLSSAAVPLLAGTGVAIWWARRRARPGRSAAIAGVSDTVILVGSEGNTTWGFAETLRAALAGAGVDASVAAMNDLGPHLRAARRFVVLTATYGDGEAPSSASDFLARLARFEAGPELEFAVLGFGDRQFPRFCGFADTVDRALEEKGLRRLLPEFRIDRQSAQGFADWGREFGAAIGVELALVHTPERPRTQSLRLMERIDYGVEIGAPTAVLRFGPGEPSGLMGRLLGARLPRFEAGDLVGMLAPGSDVPRFYSLASSSRDGVLEICVRLMPGGLCSGRLHALRPGDCIDGFVRPNPGFRPAPGHAPVILIGAGAGVGPLAGFIRSNAARRPMHLYFGARDPGSDFLYRNDLEAWLRDRRLTSLRPAFSRAAPRARVQHRLAADAEALRGLIAREAQILVCGGRDMARGVAEALAAVLAPMQLTVADLKREGRYVEDVY
ncbi:PepSY domain-containing protein [Alsobacter sp. SYSU M60028]|uniref:NADPH--hemoprotein reductase n=1 Tax=Alsobacter ponti TaxID=2962936 RepID=A0ABT1LDW3_9HYPH|nr:PepSY domain-containing protein [Alsobacter ponti]MCP8939296.1 PepSY domain-containing protein [Alsobacter ponti]